MRRWRRAFSITTSTASPRPSAFWRNAECRCDWRMENEETLHSPSWRNAMATADLELTEVPLPAEANREPEANKLFRAVMKHEGSDLHLRAGLPPMMRHRGVLKPFGKAPLSNEDLERLLYPIMTAKQRAVLEETGGADFAHIVGKDECRFRVNVFKQ